jgi:hypothetical protein
MMLSPAQQQELESAVRLLESPSFAVRLANQAGKPLDSALGVVPGLSVSLHRVLRQAILNCLTVAIESQDDEVFVPSSWRPKMLTALGGGLGGLFGAFLPIELPFTMTLMLRAVADIARHNGKDLKALEPRLSCLQVFAMGDRKSDADAAISYYAARATLTKLTADVMSSLVQRGVLDISTPVVTRLVSEVVSRFGLVLSERVAAGAIPVLGAVGGATLNVMFTDHFERVARGHFTIRRLEREHGRDAIQQLYRMVADRAERRPSVA